MFLLLLASETMADTDRVVYPDEVEDVKAKAAAAVKPEDGDSNSVEETPAEPDTLPQMQTRNMIVVPQNCPEGFQMGADGVCREVFD